MRSLVSNSIYAKKEIALLVPTKSLLKTNPDAAAVPPFLLTQNLSPKDIAGSDII